MNCFVIIGFGKKTSYADGKARILDLDETFTTLIKPVFDSLEINCYRAIDKNINGSIDKLMLEEIKNAEIVLADISTLNANVMWELGVRHALKPFHTLMICEKEQMKSVPFDINHFIIHEYAHTEDGIPNKEVIRFIPYLKEIVQKMLSQHPQPDNPVYTFLDLNTAALNVGNQAGSFINLMQKAEKLKDQKRFSEAIELFENAKVIAANNMTLRDNLSLIISRIALCTYKDDEANSENLQNAFTILEELNPNNTLDVEVLGLSGAIQKRLNEVNNDDESLEKAIDFYSRGFFQKQDYYNGINAAYMLYKKASIQKQKNDDDFEESKTEADSIRNKVLKIALALENTAGFATDNKNDVWVLFTIAEAYNYKMDATKMKEYENKAFAFAEKTDQAFAKKSYEDQKQKIKEIMVKLM